MNFVVGVSERVAIAKPFSSFWRSVIETVKLKAECLGVEYQQELPSTEGLSHPLVFLLGVGDQGLYHPVSVVKFVVVPGNELDKWSLIAVSTAASKVEGGCCCESHRRQPGPQYNHEFPV